MILTEFESLRLRLVENKNEMVGGLEDGLDRWNGGVEFQTRIVLDKVRKLHEHMMKRMESMNEQWNKTVAGLNGNDEFFFINSHDKDDDAWNELLQDEREVGQQHTKEVQREEVGQQQQQQQQYNTTVEGQREEVGQQHTNVSDNKSSIKYNFETYPHEYIEANYTDISTTSSSDANDRPATSVTEQSVRQATLSPQ